MAKKELLQGLRKGRLVEIRDPVHGSIHILNEIIPIISHPFFQRLRNIKQLGFSEFVFPGATHTRFLHSIGVMHIGDRAFDKLFGIGPNNEMNRLKTTFKLSCLLHDIGHAPLSHSTETVMPKLSSLKIPSHFLSDKDKKQDRQATHEDYTIKAIVDSSFTECFKDVNEKFGVEPARVADLIVGKTTDPQYYTVNNENYFPILHQLISSELDCDRMDYLLRDSYFCGVSYGNYDLDWLLDNLEKCPTPNGVHLGISERAVVTFDDFLLSRYHMFVMVYFHYRPVCLEQLLYRYFKTAPAEYSIPSDIEAYIEHDDHFLMKVLRNSKNKFAQSIVQNIIPAKIFESFNEEQFIHLKKIEAFLKSENIDHILSSSQSRLSKYYGSHIPEEKYPIQVIRRGFKNSQYTTFNINEATDLFTKFSKSHAVNRLYCDLNEITSAQHKKLMEFLSPNHVNE